MTASPLDALLRKLSYCRAFDPDDREALLGLPHEVRKIEAASYLVREGDQPTRCAVMISGFVYRHKIVASGGRQILSFNMRGDMVDIQNSFLGVADHNVQALTACEVAYIPCNALKELAFERPAIGEAMWFDSLVEASIFREWIANVGRRDARTRIAHVLCEFALRLEAAGLGTHANWELPMTQEQIADVVGLTSVHVNRTLRVLEQEGLIKRDRRAVWVSDWKALAEAGDFQSRYLHLPDHKLGLVQSA
ncbi:MAG TPA: Crp/Fnr family transcriptional regulator [Allosphingosinicella sp.]|nr:Crp/Fnr family transcriptional regulator [Allosphingosinicella sp.]